MILKISRLNPLDSLPPLTAPHGRQHVDNYIKKTETTQDIWERKTKQRASGAKSASSYYSGREEKPALNYILLDDTPRVAAGIF